MLLWYEFIYFLWYSWEMLNFRVALNKDDLSLLFFFSPFFFSSSFPTLLSFPFSLPFPLSLSIPLHPFPSFPFLSSLMKRLPHALPPLRLWPGTTASASTGRTSPCRTPGHETGESTRASCPRSRWSPSTTPWACEVNGSGFSRSIGPTHLWGPFGRPARGVPWPKRCKILLSGVVRPGLSGLQPRMLYE